MAKSRPAIFAIPRFALRQAVLRHATVRRGDQEKPWSTTMTEPTAAIPQRYLRTPEAARFLGISGRTLEKHRTYGTGPTYRKIGGRVIYSVADLQSWADRGAKSSTSDPGVGTVHPARRADEGRSWAVR